MRDALLLGFILACLIAAVRFPYAGVLAWAWFSLMTPHQMAFGVYGLPLNVIIAAVTIIAIAVSGEWRKFRPDATMGLLIAFGLWLGVSQWFSLDPEYSAPYFDRFIKLLLFILVCTLMTYDRLRFHALAWMLTLGLGYFAVKGALFTFVTLGQFRVQGLENTILEDNNHLGIALACILPMMLYLRSEARNPLIRTGLLSLFALTIVAILGTHSRGAFVALLAFGGFFWIKSKRKATILAALAIVVLPAIAFMPSKWSERMSTITEAGADASFIGRVDAWVINAKLAAEHPVTGAGLRNPYQKEIAATVDPARAETAKAAHSVYFEVLGGAGFVGLALYLALLAAAYVNAARLQRRAKKGAGPEWTGRFGYFAQMALVVFGVGGATVSIEMWDGYLILIALVASALRLSQEAALAGHRPERRSWRIEARGGRLQPEQRAGNFDRAP